MGGRDLREGGPGASRSRFLTGADCSPLTDRSPYHGPERVPGYGVVARATPRWVQSTMSLPGGTRGPTRKP